eukprot:714550-Pleurochrysis_carterae.AAC.2
MRVRAVLCRSCCSPPRGSQLALRLAAVAPPVSHRRPLVCTTHADVRTRARTLALSVTYVEKEPATPKVARCEVSSDRRRQTSFRRGRCDLQVLLPGTEGDRAGAPAVIEVGRLAASPRVARCSEAALSVVVY